MRKRLLAVTLALPMVCSLGSSFSFALTDEEELGKAMFFDTMFSFNNTQSCSSCHDPLAGFTDPNHTPVSLGADGQSVGGRNAPSAAYAGASPVRHLIKNKQEYVGGMFWDSRADGSTLGDPLAEQALGPPTNSLEMAMESEAAVVQVLADNYAEEFASVYNFTDFENSVDEAYALFGRAIAAYERSVEVSRFSSPYDRGELTNLELAGEELFRRHCATCHTMAGSPASRSMFTSYGYANIGLPANTPEVPGGDLGLGAVVNDVNQNGKFKIPTLRNVAMTPPYGHNGYFTHLNEMVRFMNDHDDAIYPPDIGVNVSPLIGNMGMTEKQVRSVIAFLQALTDE